ncbi:MAG: SOS response-associated peptidase family protein [Pseudomonadota bacterium]
MPVIIDPTDYDRWLGATHRDVEDLFEPFPSDSMHAWAVGRAVGNVRNQGIELTQEV